MIRVPLHQIKSGMVLARPAGFSSQFPEGCLKKGYKFGTSNLQPILKKLRDQFHILDVWVEASVSNRIDRLINEGIEQSKRDLFINVKEDFLQMEKGKKLDLQLEKYETMIESVIKGLLSDPLHCAYLERIHVSDDYLPRHAARTCYLALLMAMSMQDYITYLQRRELEKRTFQDEKNRLLNFDDVLRSLGLGMLLHDIGKLCPDIAELVKKEGALTAQEYELVKNHTVYGYIFMNQSRRSTSKIIALDHHQNFDGSGYPVIEHDETGKIRVMKGENLHPFVRIARLVDVFDAATSKRCYKSSKLPVEIMYEISRDERCFDPEFKKCFLEIMPAFELGAIVRLNNGLTCMVVDINRGKPCRPWVQILRDPYGRDLPPSLQNEINLAETQDLKIIEQEIHPSTDPDTPAPVKDVTGVLF